MLANFILVVKFDIPVHNIIISKSPNLYCTHLLAPNNMISANFIMCFHYVFSQTKLYLVTIKF